MCTASTMSRVPRPLDILAAHIDVATIANQFDRSSQSRKETMAYRFEIYRDKKNEFRFRFVAPNGEKMFASEGYVSKASAKSTIKSIVKHVSAAALDDISKAKPAAAAPKSGKKARKTKAAKSTKSKKAAKTKSARKSSKKSGKKARR
jgi:uncharacterized protein YegP (UPF0339 family)